MEDPTQTLLVDGRSSRLQRDILQHNALERGDGLIPWNGAQVGTSSTHCNACPACTAAAWEAQLALWELRCCAHLQSAPLVASKQANTFYPSPSTAQDNLIDRFDGRALLDFYRDPPPHLKNREKSSQEERLEDVRGCAAVCSVLTVAATLLNSCKRPGSCMNPARPPHALAGAAIRGVS